MNYWTQSTDNIHVAAHRGWSDKYPENTIEAFKAAVKLGVDQLETDVRVTKDNELVIMHDERVDRTTNGTGKVCEMTLAEIKALDAGIKKGEQFKGLKVPTFLEFMEYVKDLPTITLDIELKEYPVGAWEQTAYDVCDRVLKFIDDYGFSDRVVINTFSGKLQEYIQEKYGAKYKQHIYYPIMYMGGLKRDPFAYAYCCCMFSGGFFSPRNLATPFECAQAAKRGVQPWAGAGICDEAGVDQVIESGCTLITCNNPDVILEALRKKGKHK